MLVSSVVDVGAPWLSDTHTTKIKKTKAESALTGYTERKQRDSCQ